MAQKSSSMAKVAEGLGVAAIAAAAAATYFLTGEQGKKNRKKIGSFAIKAKTEMVQKLKKMETVSKKAYEEASREIMGKYKQVKNIDPKELAALGNELRNAWLKIAKDAAKLGRIKKPATKKKARA